MALVDSLVVACLIPLAIAAVISGLDDLVLDVALAWGWLRNRRAGRAPAAGPPPSERERLVAIFLPLWREEAVIRPMLERNLAAIRYRNYQVFAGVYANDPATMEAVRQAEQEYPRVHLAIVPHNGPTSKADCLNWIFQAMRAHEEACGERFDLVVTHDAEDVIHPDSLSWINHYAACYDMIQVPVLPLPSPFGWVTHGVYCDEFAEFQTKDVPVRRALGGFLPSNGVGTGYSRRALDALAAEDRNRLFDPSCLTEDYDCGLRLFRMGFRQVFLPLQHQNGGPVATREYFPRSFRQAVRQRSRWVTGICLQSWEKHGWRGGLAAAYWFWRDRKGLLGNPLSLLGNLVCLYGAVTFLYSHWLNVPWGLSGFRMGRGGGWLLWLALAMQAHRLMVRTACCARAYGISFALGTPLRAIWSNWMNAIATLTAIIRYARARLAGAPLVWQKTEHVYPAVKPMPRPAPVVLEIDPASVRPEIARALPLAMARRWRVAPVEVREGALVLAAAAPPPDELFQDLKRITRLRVEVVAVTGENFARLAKLALA